MFRVNNECHIFGHVSIIDWLFFFGEYYPSALGIRVIKDMFLDHGKAMCVEMRRLKEGYGFSELKYYTNKSNIIPPQIECCLQETLLEASLTTSFKCEFQVHYK